MISTNVPAPVKRVVHAGSVTFGRLTSGARLLPTFLLCGGQRCGTTSLYRTLAAHPAILKAVLHKGVHYFDTNHHRGLEWYRGHFPLTATGRAVSRRLGVAPAVFESSPYYLYHPHAAARIAHELPDVRIVVLVRDPVERAYSHHAHELARGFETITDFAAAVAAENGRLAAESVELANDPTYYSFAHQHHAYVARGEYADHLDRFATLFDTSRLHVIDAGALFADPAPVYARLLDFLGLPPVDDPPFERHNARPRPRPMPDAVRTALTAHFAPYDARLEPWLGTRPSWRR